MTIQTSASRPGLIFTGSMMGRNPGYTAPMGEIIAGLLQKDGYPVVVTSGQINRARRLAEILYILAASRRKTSIQVLQIYSGMSFIMEDLASLLAKRLGYQIVMHVHGGAIPEFIQAHPGWSRRVFHRADRIVAPSAYLARCLIQFGFPVDIIPNVIDLSLYPFRLREQVQPNLLWMRAFHPVYNPEMAVDVLRMVSASYLQARMVMAGQEKGSLDQVKAKAAREGVSERIRFPGYLCFEQKRAAFGQADLFINTNQIDNAPVSLLEACACGLPVITTDAGGIPDMLRDQVDALLIPVGAAEQMAGRVFELLENPAQARSLSENGRKLAETCDWQVVGKTWRALLDEVAKS